MKSLIRDRKRSVVSGARAASLSLILALILAVMITAANASTVTFKFLSTVGGNGTNIPGTAVGDAFEILIFADNGSSSISNQVWGLGDYFSAVVNIDNPDYVMLLDSSAANFNAATNTAGVVTAIGLGDITGNADSLGNTSFAGVIVNGSRNIVFANLLGNVFADAVDLTTPDNWTASNGIVVPAPAALPLFLSGLFGLGILARRKRKQTAIQ